MAFKDLIVHVDNGPNCAKRIGISTRLAVVTGAHLVGLYVKTVPHVPQFIQAHISDEVLEAQREAVDEMAARAEADFRSTCMAAGVPCEWRCAEGDAAEILTMNARYADLVILGQYDPENDVIPGADELPDRLVLSAGRPVLVIPHSGVFANIGERIMVAWDSSRLAARAVSDAMSLMQIAKRVSVMAVNPKGGNSGHGQVPGADICLHLARHGVKAEAQHIVADDIDPGNMLLSRAADEGADMIVMGAYGHRRLRELVLGGMTRHMLKHMTVPVFMSH